MLVNYTRGDTLSAANFVPFYYDPTNLTPGGFTLINGGDLYISGSIADTLPGTEDLFFYGTIQGTTDHRVVQTFNDGRWCVGSSCIQPLDEGFSHAWNAATAMPEPMSIALLGAGLVGLAAVRRRA